MSKWNDPLPQYLFSGGRVAQAQIGNLGRQGYANREHDFYTPNVQMAGTPAIPPMSTMNIPAPNVGVTPPTGASNMMSNLPSTGAGPITVDVDTNLPTYTAGQLLQADRNSTGFRAIDPTQTTIPEAAPEVPNIDITPDPGGNITPAQPGYRPPGTPGYVPGTTIPGGGVGPAGGIGSIGGPGSIGGAGGWLDFDADSIWDNDNQFQVYNYNSIGR